MNIFGPFSIGIDYKSVENSQRKKKLYKSTFFSAPFPHSSGSLVAKWSSVDNIQCSYLQILFYTSNNLKERKLKFTPHSKYLSHLRYSSAMKILTKKKTTNHMNYVANFNQLSFMTQICIIMYIEAIEETPMIGHLYVRHCTSFGSRHRFHLHMHNYIIKCIYFKIHLILYTLSSDTYSKAYHALGSREKIFRGRINYTIEELAI